MIYSDVKQQAIALTHQWSKQLSQFTNTTKTEWRLCWLSITSPCMRAPLVNKIVIQYNHMTWPHAIMGDSFPIDCFSVNS